ncbi:MAG: DUF362 domain-containing protein [Pseudomonadota bacterium]
MAASVVAVLRTTPNTVVEDYARLLDLAGCGAALDEQRGAFVKVCHSHNDFFPSAGTPPWQLDGVLGWLGQRGLRRDQIVVGENRTVSTELSRVKKSHRWAQVVARHGVRFLDLDTAVWDDLEGASDGLVADWTPFGGPAMPREARGKTLVHLAPMKVHGHSVATGSMKSAFNLLLRYRTCHRAHRQIHETLADMLYLQHRVLGQELIGVIDGVFGGNGKGPVTLTPVEKNVILASRDLVALDAVAVSMMGFEPRAVPFVWMAHQRGLGCADLSRISVVGEDIRGVSFGFKSERNLVIYVDQLLRRRLGPGARRVMLDSPLDRLAITASLVYHNVYWGRLLAPRRMKGFHESGWARCWEGYAAQ